jgi:hypothetical protein
MDGLPLTNPLTQGYPTTATLNIRVPAQELGCGNIVRRVRVSYGQVSAAQCQTSTLVVCSEAIPAWFIPNYIEIAWQR